MARITTRIDPIERDIEVLFPDPFSERSQKEALVSFAKQGLADAQRQNAAVLGRVPPHQTFVDGRQGAAIESVRPDGQVVFEFELLEDIFGWIGEQLIKHSPRGEPTDRRPDHPDLYMRSHVFAADMQVIDPGAPVPPAAEYVFLNTQPYARKIERGLSSQAPDGVYQVVAELAQRRFGNMARIRFSYRSPLDFGSIVQWAATTDMASPHRRGAKRDEWLTRQPAIVITPR